MFACLSYYRVSHIHGLTDKVSGKNLISHWQIKEATRGKADFDAEAAMNDHLENLRRDDGLLVLIDIEKTGPIHGDRLGAQKAVALLDVAKVFALLGLLNRAKSEKVVDKVEFSGLEISAIAEAVRRSGRRTLLLIGTESHVYIFHTSIHVLRLGCRVHVAADMVSSHSAVNRHIGINRLGKARAVLSSTEVRIYEHLQRAGTAKFLTLLPLLKTLRWSLPEVLSPVSQRRAPG
jgi:nicotinamidase-related amidase